MINFHDSNPAFRASLFPYFRQALFKTDSQPKSLALAGDNTLFVVEQKGIEAIRSNQKVFDLKPTYDPTAVAATGATVAIGAQVYLLLILVYFNQ